MAKIRVLPPRAIKDGRLTDRRSRNAARAAVLFAFHDLDFFARCFRASELS
jgi:hypothetical protein